MAPRRTTQKVRGFLIVCLALLSAPLSAVAFAPRGHLRARRCHHHLSGLAAINRVPDLPVLGTAAPLLWHGDLAQLLTHEAARGPVSRIRFRDQEVFLLSDPALVNPKPKTLNQSTPNLNPKP